MAIENMRIGNHTLEMGNLDKVIFPDIGLTQGGLLRYYRKISAVMLPHLKDRPLTLQRFPDGIDADGFYQKKIPDYFPGWITTAEIDVKEKRGSQHQVVCNTEAALAYLVDQGCITFHIWQSRKDKLEHPDRMIFDLDPAGEDFGPVREGAFRLRKLLEKIGLSPFVMTTGSRGLHVVVPLQRRYDFDTVRQFARNVAETLADRDPDRFTTEMSKKKRKGRLFLDYLRNSYGQNSVAPYAVRAKPGAPVATPIEWDELKSSNLHSQTYTVQNILRRMGQKQDPWQDIGDKKYSIKKAEEKLTGLTDDD